MPSINIVVDTTPIYIRYSPVTTPTIGVKFGAVDSVNGQTGTVLVNAVPNGGTTGQVLAKNSNTDNDTEWVNPSGGGGTWGSITGTLSSQTDLQTALDAKEDEANKKNTITNSTTDYPSGKAVYDAFAERFSLLPIISGLWRGALGVGNISSGTWPAGSAWCVPYYVSKKHTVTAIRCHVSTSVAGTSVRMALYKTSGGYEPVTVLDESGPMSAASAGIIKYTFLSPIELTEGLYWMSIQVSASTVGLYYFLTGIASNFPRASSQPFAAVRSTVSYGSFPSPMSGHTYITSSAGNTPILELLPQ